MTYTNFKKNSFLVAKRSLFIQLGIFLLVLIVQLVTPENEGASGSGFLKIFYTIAILIPIIIVGLSFLMIIANTIWDLIIASKKGAVAKSSWLTMIFNILNFFLFVLNFYFTAESAGGAWN